MTEGWRTVVVQSAMKLSIRDGRLILGDLQEKREQAVPLDEISRVIVMSVSGVVTLAVLRELAERHVSVIFCNKRYHPVAEITPFAVHEETAGAIMDQAAWTDERKEYVWAEIVRNKIANQMRLLERHGKEAAVLLLQNCMEQVTPGDPANREALAGKVYFRALFGNEFRRHAPDGWNAALNYGYSLICSGISRSLAAHGYHTALGIHHANRGNKVNLSCDLMEPFRPFVDRVVAERRISLLGTALKKELILLTQEPCLYAGKKMSIDTAMEMYSLDVMKRMKDGRQVYRRVEFE